MRQPEYVRTVQAFVRRELIGREAELDSLAPALGILLRERVA